MMQNNIVDENENNTHKKDKFLSSFYDFASILVTALLIVFVIFTFGFKISAISGESMENTLHNANQVVVKAIPGEIKQGDIVIISQPNAYGKVLIKRVVGVGGQTISFDPNSSKTIIDGEIIDEPYIKEPMIYSYNMMHETKIPNYKYFVMGDNRNNSADSRDPNIGLIDERYIVGKVVFRLGDFKPIK